MLSVVVVFLSFTNFHFSQTSRSFRKAQNYCKCNFRMFKGQIFDTTQFLTSKKNKKKKRFDDVYHRTSTHYLQILLLLLLLTNVIFTTVLLLLLPKLHDERNTTFRFDNTRKHKVDRECNIFTIEQNKLRSDFYCLQYLQSATNSLRIMRNFLPNLIPFEYNSNKNILYKTSSNHLVPISP